MSLDKKNSRSKMMKHLIFGVLVSGIAFYWLISSIEVDEFFATFKNINSEPLVVAIFATFFSYFLRSLRWPFFFERKNLKFIDSFRCLIVGFFMNNVLPARLGELVRAHLGGVATRQSRARVLATIAGERLFDGLSISIIFACLFSVNAKAIDESYNNGITYVAYGFAFVSVMTAVVIWQRHFWYNVLGKVGEIFPGHLSTYTLSKIRKFIEGLEPMLHFKRLMMIVIGSAAVWGVELFVYLKISEAFGQELNTAQLSLMLAAVNFSSLIPAAPGGVGVIEAFATGAMVQVGIDAETAFAMVATQHAIQIAVVGIPGLLFFLLQMRGRMPSFLRKGSLSTEDENQSAEVEQPSSAIFEAPSVDLSVVIPAYNEEHRIPSTILSVIEYLNSTELNYEIIVVNDGSSDKTAKVIQNISHLSPQVRLVSYSDNQGKGYAVRQGIFASLGAKILFNDADGATPIEEVQRLLPKLDEGADVAIGSRALYSRDTNVRTIWLRKFMGRSFNGLVNFLLLPGIADTQCGFKLFSRNAAREIFSRAQANGFSFDVEILSIARSLNYKIEEVAINWTNIPGSKVNLAKDSLMMFIDVIKFRFNKAVGTYKEPQQSFN